VAQDLSMRLLEQPAAVLDRVGQPTLDQVDGHPEREEAMLAGVEREARVESPVRQWVDLRLGDLSGVVVGPARGPLADLRAEESAEVAAPFREVAVAPVLVALAASRAATQAKTAMVSVAALPAGTVSTAAKALALVFACRRHIHAPGTYAVVVMPDTRCTPATAS
jgi:hypothetical protein